MTFLSLPGSLLKLLLGPVSSGPSSLDASINGDPSLTIMLSSSSHFTRLMPLFMLIIPHCGNHKKGKLSHFHLRSFFEVFFFSTNGSQLCFPPSVALSSPAPSLTTSHSLPLSSVSYNNKSVIIIDFSSGLISILFILIIRAPIRL